MAVSELSAPSTMPCTTTPVGAPLGRTWASTNHASRAAMAGPPTCPRGVCNRARADASRRLRASRSTSAHLPKQCSWVWVGAQLDASLAVNHLPLSQLIQAPVLLSKLLVAVVLQYPTCDSTTGAYASGPPVQMPTSPRAVRAIENTPWANVCGVRLGPALCSAPNT